MDFNITMFWNIFSFIAYFVGLKSTFVNATTVLNAAAIQIQVHENGYRLVKPTDYFIFRLSRTFYKSMFCGANIVINFCCDSYIK